MTKKAFTSLVVNMLTTSETSERDKASCELMLRTLMEQMSIEPIDKEKFSKMGLPHLQTTPEECWK